MRIFDFPRSKEDQATSWRPCRQLVTRACAVILAALVAWPAIGQELKQASSSLSAKISESGRKRVAVVDFTDLQGNVSELGRYLAEEFSGALVNDARGFRVMDRAHLKALLQEHRLATTGLIDPKTARQLGQFAGVDTLVTGTITSAFGDTVRVMVKALDVSTAEIIGQFTVEIPKTEAIQRLLGQSIGSPIQTVSNDGGSGDHPVPAPTSPTTSVEENDLLFVVKGCRRSGSNLSCMGSVTNKSSRSRWVYFGSGIQVVDELGGQYEFAPIRHMEAKLDFGRDLSQELEPRLPVNFSLSVTNINPAAARVNIILTYGAPEPGQQPPTRVVWMGEKYPDKLVFRDVPIQRK